MQVYEYYSTMFPHAGTNNVLFTVPKSLNIHFVKKICESEQE